MKAKVIKEFRDKHTGEIYKVGKTLTISEERYNEILTVGELVKEIKSKPAKEKTAE